MLALNSTTVLAQRRCLPRNSRVDRPNRYRVWLRMCMIPSYIMTEWHRELVFPSSSFRDPRLTWSSTRLHSTRIWRLSQISFHSSMYYAATVYLHSFTHLSIGPLTTLLVSIITIRTKWPFGSVLLVVTFFRSTRPGFTLLLLKPQLSIHTLLECLVPFVIHLLIGYCSILRPIKDDSILFQSVHCKTQKQFEMIYGYTLLFWSITRCSFLFIVILISFIFFCIYGLNGGWLE